MSTRANVAGRHVRQRKLNPKQPLRILREGELEDTFDDEGQRNIPQVETGVEKGEEIEFHLQAVINAANATALGAKASQQSYIPTPDATKAKGVKYDDLYPKVFSQPSTYIRFSSTVEDSIGVPYCMNDDDVEVLARLNDGKDVNGQPRKDKLNQCSEDTFEEVMSFFEEFSVRSNPFANYDTSTPLPSIEEMQNAVDETISADAQKRMKLIYQYWASRKSNRALMPTIKVRVLDTSSEADDADPYVCFRRREVRQTRKTRGRDAQVVEKLKKLRLELEQARHLVQMVVQREQLNKEDLEVSRRVFEERRKLKDVKVNKQIIGEKGEDEELLVNQKPAPKPKARQDPGQRPPMMRIRSGGDRAPENDLVQLADLQAEAEAEVQQAVRNRKEQHRRWNQQWIDETWRPITPPLDSPDDPPQWAPLLFPAGAYPTPPPTLPSEGSRDKEDDIEMADPPIKVEEDVVGGAPPDFEPELIFHIPGAYPVDEEPEWKRDPAPACRLRYGRGGRRHLEVRRKRPFGLLSPRVVSDSDSDEEMPDYFTVDPRKIFEYRVLTNMRARPDGMSGERRHHLSGDQAAMVAQAQAQAQASSATPSVQVVRQSSSGSAG